MQSGQTAAETRLSAGKACATLVVKLAGEANSTEPRTRPSKRISLTMNEKTIETILHRHSCREFTGGELPEEHLKTLMDCLRWAPSAGNLQPWFFYIVVNPQVKQHLARAAFGQDFIARAAVVFVVCAEPEASAVVYGERGTTLYCLQDTAAAVENLLLATTALGYGSCWIGAFNEELARKALDIPPHLRPVAIVPIGPGKPIVRFPGRKTASEIFEFVK